MQHRFHFLRRHFGIHDLHFLKIDGPFLFVKDRQRFQFQLNVRFLAAKQGVHIQFGVAGERDFIRLFAANLADELIEYDMGIGNAGHTDIFGEVIVFFQRLINFLLTNAVLRKLVTTDQQAADN
ncbi:hypothetical protein D3C81_1855800 [compost metagenome]